ncbi:arrestin domain-containing protein 1 [Aphomia sociella]
MSWKTCSVLLNTDSTKNLYAGDIVTGSVILEFQKKQNIEKIDLQIIGYCKAQWTRPMPTIPYIKIYSEKRKVLHIEMNLIENLGRQITPGSYNLPFHFSLPEDLPSTFQSSIAKTCYYIKLQIQGKRTSKKIVPFIVLENVNLNSVEEFSKPSTYTFEKSFWNSGSLSLKVKTYKGFAPTQIVPFEVTIHNEKQVKIRRVNVLLIQKRHYSVTQGYADEEKIVCKAEYDKILSVQNETLKFSMRIPHLTPSSINVTDPIINISYVLRVEVIFLFYSTLYENIPVTIATSPVIHYDFENE